MKDRYPLGARAHLEDFYVDDLFTGADSVTELQRMRDEVEAVGRTGGFTLNKWASNCRQVLAGIARDRQDGQIIIQESNSTINALGIQWHPQRDRLTYCLESKNTSPKTKLAMLSKICRIFDSLGLIGPIVLMAKILIQDLWKTKIAWDDSLPAATLKKWDDFEAALNGIEEITVPRKVTKSCEAAIELHGFADASEAAFGACIYVVSVERGEQRDAALLCAKSRVAPLKQLSIPRLELAAAVLLAELMNEACLALRAKTETCYYYTDSQVTLSWIKSESRRFKIFVANRVGEIQRLSNPERWSHIDGNQNQADLISRGMNARELAKSQLWWHGPRRLLEVTSTTDYTVLEGLPELRCLIATPSKYIWPEFSSFSKGSRICAYVLRFLQHLRGGRQRGELTIPERVAGTKLWIKTVQEMEFLQEIKLIRDNTITSGPLRQLSPFIDADGILRVGGRLVQAQVSYNQKCPILLPKSHAITRLLVREVHVTQLHAGVQGTLAAVRAQYWPIQGRNVTRAVVRACVVCRRCKPTLQPPVMASLPQSRVTAGAPFAQCGVDYAGPISMKEGSRRSKRAIRVYVAVFICLTTKATHLELVTDLTTEAFIAALNRTMARRGKVVCMHSDNATNFLGAANKLREMGQFLRAEEQAGNIRNCLAAKNIEWKFIPPRGPHFGGLYDG